MSSLDDTIYNNQEDTNLGLDVFEPRLSNELVLYTPLLLQIAPLVSFLSLCFTALSLRLMYGEELCRLYKVSVSQSAHIITVSSWIQGSFLSAAETTQLQRNIPGVTSIITSQLHQTSSAPINHHTPTDAPSSRTLVGEMRHRQLNITRTHGMHSTMDDSNLGLGSAPPVGLPTTSSCTY